MPTRYREVEVKLDAPVDAAVPPLDGLDGVAAVDEPVEQQLSATYFDTEGGALAAARISLRRRMGGDDAGWHLKVPARGDGRDELRLPLGRARTSVPVELREAAQLFVRDEPLRPIAELRTRRMAHRLRDAAGRVLVEVADDTVVARTLPDGEPMTWREWEVEVVDGDPGLLDAAIALLGEAGATPAASRSKLARVLGDDRAATASEPVPSLAPQSEAREVLHPALRAQVDALRIHDPLVRADVEGGVHRMRVAARRLRSILATFRPLVDRAAGERIRRELHWIAGELGEARDAEVQRRRLAELVASQPVELVLGPVALRIDDDLRTRRRSAQTAVLEAMRSERYLVLMDDLERFAEAPPWTADASRTAADVLRSRMRREHRRMRRRIDAADAAPDAAARDGLLHEARKAAKRARYAAEVLAPAFGTPAQRLARAAKRVQSVLGEQHDTVVVREALRELGVRAHLDGDNAFSYGLLHARELAAAVELEGEMARAQAKAMRPRLRRWLD
ncbi:CHAD domain-containing protein [Agrococcus sp. UYP10]|uniref:CYTH and CHAD domain-containing protein n=1 Tax=Agrococcus sp. UYP10 TaxID=1756355 RepID=UPI0033962CEE